MSKIVSIINQKGGVGKTTTVMNLGTALASIGKKVLICDIDPQGNASTGLGISQEMRGVTIYDGLIGRSKMSEIILATKINRLFVAPSCVDLAAAEIELSGKNDVLRLCIDSIESEYDFILIDCPPSLGMLTVNGLCAADSIIIPVQCEFFALEGLSHLMNTYEIIKESGICKSHLDIEGVILTMYDKRNNLTQEVENEVRKAFGGFVYNTVIPRNIRISEAPSYGLPVMMYDIDCPGSTAYINLAKEFIAKNRVDIN